MLAIHCPPDEPNHPGHYWAAWCAERALPYKAVDCLAADIFVQVQGCTDLLWYWHNDASQFASQLVRALEIAGVRVFPSFGDSWFIDDKIAQYYLFQALQLPTVPTWVHHRKQDALEWMKRARFPKLLKLKSSESGRGVWMVPNRRRARQLIRLAFGKGFARVHARQVAVNHWHRFLRKKDLSALWLFIKTCLRILGPKRRDRFALTGPGYAYFQRYIQPVRKTYQVVVHGDRAYGLIWIPKSKASHISGAKVQVFGTPETVPQTCVALAFQAAEKIGAHYLALEMLLIDGRAHIIEADPGGRLICQTSPGYWDAQGHWHARPSIPAEQIIARQLHDASAYAASDAPD